MKSKVQPAADYGTVDRRKRGDEADNTVYCISIRSILFSIYFRLCIKKIFLSLGRVLSNQVIFLFAGYFSANHPFPSFRRDSEHVRIFQRLL